MSDLMPCPFCGSAEDPDIQTGLVSNTWIVVCGGCGGSSDYEGSEAHAIAGWNRRAPADPALMALAKFGALVLDWSPLECGFPTIPGSVVDAMAVRSGCALEDSGDGGHACWTAPNVRLTIARLLAPDGADGAGEVPIAESPSWAAWNAAFPHIDVAHAPGEE